MAPAKSALIAWAYCHCNVWPIAADNDYGSCDWCGTYPRRYNEPGLDRKGAIMLFRENFGRWPKTIEFAGINE